MLCGWSRKTEETAPGPGVFLPSQLHLLGAELRTLRFHPVLKERRGINYFIEVKFIMDICETAHIEIAQFAGF